MTALDSKPTGRSAWSYIALATGLFVLAYPPVGLRYSVLVATWPLAALVFSNAAPDPRSLWRYSASYGQLIGLGVVGYWMFLAASDYFNVCYPGAAALTFFIVAIFVALFYAPVLPAARRLRSFGPLLRVVGFASIWTACEFARSVVGYGNPWTLLGHPLTTVPGLGQIAELWGIWPLTWLAAAGGAALAAFFRQPRDAAAATALAGVATAIALASLGGTLLHSQGVPADITQARSADGRTRPQPTGYNEPLPATQPLRVAIVQPSYEGKLLNDTGTGASKKKLAILGRMSAGLTKYAPDLIVWPESALTIDLIDQDRAQEALARAEAALAAVQPKDSTVEPAKQIPTLTDDLRSLSTTLGTPILLGATRGETSDNSMRNTAYLVRPGQHELEYYDKQLLLPLAEYRPPWLNTILTPPDEDEFSNGSREVMFEIRGRRILPLICFEAIYPRFVRDRMQQGPDLFINLSNDSWFDAGAGPAQHFEMARLRAIEHRRPLLRVATTGISGAVSASGSSNGNLLPALRPAVAVFDVPPPGRAGLYGSTGDSFAYLAMLVAAGLLLTSGRERNRE